MYVKVMPKSYQGYKFILCIINDVFNYWITVCIHQSMPEKIGDTLADEKKCNLKILYTSYSYGSRQCIYAITDELYIPKNWYKN